MFCKQKNVRPNYFIYIPNHEKINVSRKHTFIVSYDFLIFYAKTGGFIWFILSR